MVLQDPSQPLPSWHLIYIVVSIGHDHMLSTKSSHKGALKEEICVTLLIGELSHSLPDQRPWVNI